MATIEPISAPPTPTQPGSSAVSAPVPISPQQTTAKRATIPIIIQVVLLTPLVLGVTSISFRLWNIVLFPLPALLQTPREIVHLDGKPYSPDTYVFRLTEKNKNNNEEPMHAFVIELPDYARHVPSDIGNIPSLYFLHVSNNPIHELPNSIGSLSSLRFLRILNTNLSALPTTFGDLTSLQTVWLMGNHIRKLPDNFGDLKNLTGLNLAYNDLDSLPASFANLTNLEYLDLTGNRFHSFPSPLPPNLRFLFIGGNPIPKTTLERMEPLLRLDAFFY